MYRLSGVSSNRYLGARRNCREREGVVYVECFLGAECCLSADVSLVARTVKIRSCVRVGVCKVPSVPLLENFNVIIMFTESIQRDDFRIVWQHK